MTKIRTFKPSQVALAIAGLYFGSAAVANAATVVTDRVSATVCNWSEATCWEGGVLPLAADNIGIIGNDEVTFNLGTGSFGEIDVGSKVNNTFTAVGEYGVLNIGDGANLTAAAIGLGVDGDFSYDVDTGDLLTSVTSKVNQTGGDVKITPSKLNFWTEKQLKKLSAEDKGDLVVGSFKSVFKGSLTLGSSGDGADSDGDDVNDYIRHTSAGIYNMSAGSLTMVGTNINIRSSGVFNVSGTADVNLLQIKNAGVVNITGSDASINAASWTGPAKENFLIPDSKVNFTLDAVGVSPIVITASDQTTVDNATGLVDTLTVVTDTIVESTKFDGNTDICSTDITIDGSAYTGDAGSFPLITTGAFISNESLCVENVETVEVVDGVENVTNVNVATGSIAPQSITITGFAEGYQVSTTQTDTALMLNIQINAPTVVNFSGSVVNEAQLNIDEQVTLSVEVTDEDGIDDVVKVEFFDGDRFISAATKAEDNKTFSANWTPTSEELGTRTIRAVSTDSLSNTTTESISIIIVDSSLADTDGDLIPDINDAFINDAAASIDADEDGYPDSWNAGKSAADSTTGLTLDAFPEDASESTDTDGDGVGNNADYYPEDGTRYLDDVTDSDGDGTPDLTDVFPDDPAEIADTDGDGVGDNADAFPDDVTETTDTDGDGVGDNSDDYPEDPTRSKDTIGTDPVNYDADDIVSGLVEPLSDIATSLNIAAGVTIDCQKVDKNGLGNEACFKVDGTSKSNIAITNEGVIEVTNDDSNKANARAFYITGNTIFNLVNRGADSVIKTLDDTIRITNADVTNGIFNEGLMTSGSADNNGYRRATIMLTGADTNIIGGITNSGTLEYKDELELTTWGYAISAGNSAGTHSIDYINNTGTIIGEVYTGDNTTIDRIDNSGIIEGHVGSLNTGGRSGALVIDAYGSVTGYEIDADKVILGAAPDVQIEDYVETFAVNAVIGEINNSGSISGIVAFGEEEAVDGKVYNSAGGSVGTIKNANEINIKMAEQVTARAIVMTKSESASAKEQTLAEASVSTIKGNFDFEGAFTFAVSVSGSDVTSSNLSIYGDANITNASLAFNISGGELEIGSSFTFLTVHDHGDDASVLMETLSGTSVFVGNTVLAISVSEDGRSLIATSIYGLDTDGDGVFDNLDYYPEDPSRHLDDVTDTDGDGTANLYDVFPEDASESADTDGDGVGDNSDYYPEDADRYIDDITDTDGDGTADINDYYPNDANEIADSDEDGVGDNADAFPFDSSRTEKTDTGGSFGFLLGFLAFIRVFVRKNK